MPARPPNPPTRLAQPGSSQARARRPARSPLAAAARPRLVLLPLGAHVGDELRLCGLEARDAAPARLLGLASALAAAAAAAPHPAAPAALLLIAAVPPGLPALVHMRVLPQPRQLVGGPAAVALGGAGVRVLGVLLLGRRVLRRRVLWMLRLLTAVCIVAAGWAAATGAESCPRVVWLGGHLKTGAARRRRRLVALLLSQHAWRRRPATWQRRRRRRAAARRWRRRQRHAAARQRRVEQGGVRLALPQPGSKVKPLGGGEAEAFWTACLPEQLLHALTPAQCVE